MTLVRFKYVIVNIMACYTNHAASVFMIRYGFRQSCFVYGFFLHIKNKHSVSLFLLSFFTLCTSFKHLIIFAVSLSNKSDLRQCIIMSMSLSLIVA